VVRVCASGVNVWKLRISTIQRVCVNSLTILAMRRYCFHVKREPGNGGIVGGAGFFMLLKWALNERQDSER
jgi:hypothetical protein